MDVVGVNTNMVGNRMEAVNKVNFIIPLHHEDQKIIIKEAERFGLTVEEYVHSLIIFDIRRLENMKLANKDLTE